jgi:hypothetical protein
VVRTVNTANALTKGLSLGSLPGIDLGSGGLGMILQLLGVTGPDGKLDVAKLVQIVLPLVLAFVSQLQAKQGQGQPAIPPPAPTPTLPPADKPVPDWPDDDTDTPPTGQRVVADFRLVYGGAIEKNVQVPLERWKRKKARQEKVAPNTRIRIDASPIDQFGKEIGPPGDNEALHALLAQLLLKPGGEQPGGVTPRLRWRIENSGGSTFITQGVHYRSDGSRSYGCTPAVKVPALAPGSGTQETGEVWLDYDDPITGQVRTFGPLPSLLCGRADE